MSDYPETDADVTTSSIREAAAVMDSLANAARCPSEQYGEYRGMATQLRNIADAREEQRRDSTDRAIPMPPEAVSDEAWPELVQAVMGYASDERAERERNR